MINHNAYAITFENGSWPVQGWMENLFSTIRVEIFFRDSQVTSSYEFIGPSPQCGSLLWVPWRPSELGPVVQTRRIYCSIRQLMSTSGNHIGDRLHKDCWFGPCATSAVDLTIEPCPWEEVGSEEQVHIVGWLDWVNSLRFYRILSRISFWNRSLGQSWLLIIYRKIGRNRPRLIFKLNLRPELSSAIIWDRD